MSQSAIDVHCCPELRKNFAMRPADNWSIHSKVERSISMIVPLGWWTFHYPFEFSASCHLLLTAVSLCWLISFFTSWFMLLIKSKSNNFCNFNTLFLKQWNKTFAVAHVTYCLRGPMTAAAAQCCGGWGLHFHQFNSTMMDTFNIHPVPVCSHAIHLFFIDNIPLRVSDLNAMSFL